MITVKQILEKYDIVTDKANSKELYLADLASLGIIEESKIPMIRRSLNKNINEMTNAEKKALVSLLENMMVNVIVEKNGKSMSYPSEKDMPTVIILKRKAIRVFPDNQKIGLYYSQALDRYVSIPFGPNAKDLSPQLNEETLDEVSQELATRAYAKRMSKIKDIEDDNDIDPVQKSIELSKQKEKLKQLSYRMRTTATDSTGKNIRPWAGTSAVKTAEKAGKIQISSNKNKKPLNVLTAKPAELAKNPNVRARDIAKAALSKGISSETIGAALGGTLGLLARRLVKEQRDRLQDFMNTAGKQAAGGQTVSPEERADMTRAAVSSAMRKGPQRLRDTKKDLPQTAADSAAKEQERFNQDVANSEKTTAGKVGGVVGSVLGLGGALKSLKLFRGAQSAQNASKGNALSKYVRKRNSKSKAAAAAAGSALGSLGSIDSSSNEPLFKPIESGHSFSSAGSALKTATVQAPTAVVPSASFVGAQNRAWGPTAASQQMYSQRPMQENNLNIFKQIIESDSSSQAIQIGEETITINKSIAKKIINLHESLNKENKKKLENMLNKDVISFRKVLNFALKQ
jgi:hypothetical protein